MPRSRRVHRTAYATFELATQDGNSAIASRNIAALLQPFLHIIKKPRADYRLVVFFDILYFLRRRLKDAPIIYSHADIEQIVGLLEPFAEVSQEEKQQHIADLQTKCPYCGKPLVLRSGKYGQFWGCSAYPKCRFTRKAE